MIQCCTHGGVQTITTLITDTLAQCMSNCSATNDCNRYYTSSEA